MLFVDRLILVHFHLFIYSKKLRLDNAAYASCVAAAPIDPHNLEPAAHPMASPFFPTKIL